MLRRICPLLFLFALSAPATAQSTMSAEEFDQYTAGKTLFYGADGKLYGVERYLPGRRVVWSFLDGRCQDGSWYPEGDMICFVYTDGLGPQCWRFQLNGRGLSAQFENETGVTELYEAEDIDEKMICQGPDIGV